MCALWTPEPRGLYYFGFALVVVVVVVLCRWAFLFFVRSRRRPGARGPGPFTHSVFCIFLADGGLVVVLKSGVIFRFVQRV